MDHGGELQWSGVRSVVMWRRGDVSGCILAATVCSWMLFRVSSYTLLSLLSNVLLLLLSILFLWSKAARLLNRPEPPIPEMRISQQVVNEMAALLQSVLNTVFSLFHDMALGRDSVLFYQAFLCLWLISVLGSLIDFPTFCYTCIVALLTIPALYHKYQQCIHRYTRIAYMNLRMYEMVYERFSIKCYFRSRNWIVEVLKET